MNNKLLVLSVLVMGCGAGTEFPAPLSSSTRAAGLQEADLLQEIPHARGATLCDYQLYPDLPVQTAPAMIERDRMYMAARPGLEFKYLPLTLPTPEDPYIYSGGRYLLDTEEHARDYADWVINDYTLDGVRFVDRPYFVRTECRPYSVIGLKDFSDLRTTHIVVRTERFQLPEGHHHRDDLEDRWHKLVEEARSRGLASVWLLYNREERLAAIVYTINHVGPVDPTQPDFATLSALQSAPSLGAVIARPDWVRTQDVTQFIWGLWFKFLPGDHGLPTVWPNSPPLPKPFRGDGLCLVSAGDNAQNDPADCLPTCGNAIPDPGETTVNCPEDVPLPQ